MHLTPELSASLAPTVPSTFGFAASYGEARRKFLAACTLRGLQAQWHAHPLRGAEGEALAVDVARVGPADARRVLVLTSGVHGVELFAGSGCQIDWLLSAGPDALPAGTAVVLVHGINPWGASWLRRYNEDNADLCRNYLDFTQPLPSSARYARLHAAATAAPGDEDADAVVLAFEREHGHEALYNALMGGQYAHAQGMGFGGNGPTWSRRTMEALLQQHAGSASHVCLVDYHTGLGPYGYGSMVALQQGAALARMRAAFGAWVIAVAEAEAPEDFAPVSGHTTPGYERALPGAEVTAGVLEFGTGRPQHMLQLLLDDQRDWAQGASREALLPAARQRREALRDFFYPPDGAWQASLAAQSRLVVAQGLAFLAAAG